MEEEDLYRYKPLPGPGFTRILTVRPASYDNDLILADIEPALIHEPSNYAALSYSWAMNDGDASFCRSIVIDGMLKPVTRNLYEALRRLRYRDGKLRIWVDAVCIDQTNVGERTSHVRQMDEIYRNASIVFAWLGEMQSDLESRNILYWLKASCSGRRYSGIPTRRPWVFGDGQKSDICTGLCKGAKPGVVEAHGYCRTSRRQEMELIVQDRLLAARYWTRRWIVQELAIPKAEKILFTWAPANLSLAAVTAALEGTIESKRECFDNRQLTTEKFGKLLRRRIRFLRSLQDDTLDLPKWLGRCTELECADPRDRLCSLLSLDRTWDLRPDYSASTAQGFTDFATSLVRKGLQDLLFQNLPGAEAYDSNQVLLDRVFEQRDKSLPSWVPDLGLPFRAPVPAEEATGQSRLNAHVRGNTFCYNVLLVCTCTESRSLADGPRQDVLFRSDRTGLEHHMRVHSPIDPGDVVCYLPREKPMSHLQDSLASLREVAIHVLRKAPGHDDGHVYHFVQLGYLHTFLIELRKIELGDSIQVTLL